MRRPLLGFYLVALLAVAQSGTGLAADPSPSGSPKWIVEPTCTATASDLSCTGKAAGVQPKQIDGVGPVVVGISGTVHYTCADPAFDVFWTGGSGSFIGGGGFQNGKSVTASVTPPEIPPLWLAQVGCTSGVWVRDPNYYDVHVDVGWGLGSPAALTALDATIGTVSPG